MITAARAALGEARNPLRDVKKFNSLKHAVLVKII